MTLKLFPDIFLYAEEKIFQMNYFQMLLFQVALYVHFRNVLVNPVHIRRLSAHFSARYLQAMQPFPEGFHMKLKEYLAAINSGDTVLRGWDTVVHDKQFFHHLGRGQDEYIVDKVHKTFRFTELLTVQVLHRMEGGSSITVA